MAVDAAYAWLVQRAGKKKEIDDILEAAPMTFESWGTDRAAQEAERAMIAMVQMQE